MEKEKLVCPICGEPTFVYMGNARKDHLCRKHGQMAKNGEIVQCPDCGKWNEKDVVCDCKKENKESKPENELACIICGEPSNGKPQCKNCYHETKNHLDNLDKNSSVRKLRDHYYNLKERIVIINSIEEVKNQCNKLIAIAMLDQNINDDTSLMDRVYNDVERIIKSKKLNISKTKNNLPKEEIKEKDENKSKINMAEDGHVVESDMEVRIDDTLYNKFILHSYGKSIDEIIEKRKKCDWFIPISNGKGIYIEYWGKDTPDYIKNRKEKEELYKKHNIPYIGIEKDDPKKDTQTFTSNLLKDLRKLAEEYFGFMPEWKK